MAQTSAPDHGRRTIVVTEHHIQTAHGVLNYEARSDAAIRNDETARCAVTHSLLRMLLSRMGQAAPLTSCEWRPTTIRFCHTEVFGPRRITAAGMVDNAETLLTHSDLVFYDPSTLVSAPGTSRVRQGFLSVLETLRRPLNSFAPTASSFMRKSSRVSRCESYGTWRVCGTLNCSRTWRKDRRVMLISGGVQDR